MVKLFMPKHCLELKGANKGIFMIDQETGYKLVELLENAYSGFIPGSGSDEKWMNEKQEVIKELKETVYKTFTGSPKFGDILENPFASTDNPHKKGIFVKEFRRTGKLNPGLIWELTDGNGNFWETNREIFQGKL